MPDFDFADDIAAFHAERIKLLREHGRVWVIFADGVFRGAFPEFEDAAAFAAKTLGDRRFLIRHTEEHAPHIPLVIVEAR